MDSSVVAEKSGRISNRSGHSFLLTHTTETLLVAPPETGFKPDREALLTAELAASQAAMAENKALPKRLAKLEGEIATAATQAVSVRTGSADGTGSKKQAAGPAIKLLTAVPALPDSKSERESRARELRAQGLTIPAIAEELGASISSIKRSLAAAAA